MAQISELGSPDSQLEPKIKRHNVDEAIRNLEDRKCPAPDGIDGVIVKRLHKCLPNFWTSLFNKCFILGCFPKGWKKARVIAIPKSDKTKLQAVQGYRGISLLSITGQCLENLVIERLQYIVETAGQIPPQQYGFTADRSTAGPIKTVSEFVCHSRKLGQKCCLLALDIAGAFDSAWHPRILARFRKLKCPPNIYSMVRDFLSDPTAHVTLGNSFSSKCVTKWCLQGSVSGPTLWNIIISDLTAIPSNTPDLKIVVFADDIMIMMQGPSIPTLFTTLQTTLQTIEDWCKEHRLEISKDKSVLMPVLTRNRKEYKRQPTTVAWGKKVV
jgi:hypothetical protein